MADNHYDKNNDRTRTTARDADFERSSDHTERTDRSSRFGAIGDQVRSRPVAAPTERMRRHGRRREHGRRRLGGRVLSDHAPVEITIR